MGLGQLVSALGIALRSVRRNTLRAALTILGISIGIAAVVTVTALGTGARANVNAQVANMGSNALTVYAQSARVSGARSAAAGSRLSETDSEALPREATSIAVAAPYLRTSSQVTFEAQNAPTGVWGTRLSFFTIRNWNIDKGELWSQDAESSSEKVVVLGSVTAQTLFGDGDPIGRSIRIGRYPFRVLGVLQAKGQSPFGRSQDEIVIMPISTMRSHLVAKAPKEVSGIVFSATSAETTERAKTQAEQILRQRHHLKEGDEDDFRVRSQAEFQQMQDGIYGALSTLLISIAAISLVVGGIGIMNIMLVSVAERTREIGIRMAIGAREADILTQFLIESLVLATLGGVVGTLAGYGAIVGFARALDWPMRLEPQSLLVALGVSTAIGLVFGYFPARSAARLDPVDALGR